MHGNREPRSRHYPRQGWRPACRNKCSHALPENERVPATQRAHLSRRKLSITGATSWPSIITEPSATSWPTAGRCRGFAGTMGPTSAINLALARHAIDQVQNVTEAVRLVKEDDVVEGSTRPSMRGRCDGVRRPLQCSSCTSSVSECGLKIRERVMKLVGKEVADADRLGFQKVDAIADERGKVRPYSPLPQNRCVPTKVDERDGRGGMRLWMPGHIAGTGCAAFAATSTHIDCCYSLEHLELRARHTWAQKVCVVFTPAINS